MQRVIKRYANRKLYDTATSRYVALEDIARCVRGGDEVHVTDNESGEDLTSVTLAQIILGGERRRQSPLSLELLQNLVRDGGDAIAGVAQKGLSVIGEVRDQAERLVVEESARGTRLLEDVLRRSRDRMERLQHRIDEALAGGMARLRGVGPEIERIEVGLREIEARLRTLLGDSRGTQPVAAGDKAASANGSGAVKAATSSPSTGASEARSNF